MGCFGYICPVCGKNIRAGESCLLIHKRDGRELGRTTGHYDGYGGVEEDTQFRGDEGINNHAEVCTSEFRLPSSFYFDYMRITPAGTIINAGDIHAVVKAFLNEYQFEQLSANPDFSAIINDELKSSCEKEAKFVAHLCGSSEMKGKETFIQGLLYDKMMLKLEHEWQYLEKVIAWADALPKWNGATSGVVAVHSVCCQEMNEEELDKLPFSLPDPDQGCGTPRKEFGTK